MFRCSVVETGHAEGCIMRSNTHLSGERLTDQREELGELRFGIQNAMAWLS